MLFLSNLGRHLDPEVIRKNHRQSVLVLYPPTYWSTIVDSCVTVYAICLLVFVSHFVSSDHELATIHANSITHTYKDQKQTDCSIELAKLASVSFVSCYSSYAKRTDHFIAAIIFFCVSTIHPLCVQCWPAMFSIRLYGLLLAGHLIFAGYSYVRLYLSENCWFFLSMLWLFIVIRFFSALSKISARLRMIRVRAL